jgi:hypothetical protein
MLPKKDGEPDIFQRTRKSLCGIPLEVSDSAPTDKIVIHPDIAAKLEGIGFTVHATVSKCR